MISIDEARMIPLPAPGCLRNGHAVCEIGGKRWPGKVKLLPLRDLEQRVDLRRPDFNIVVEEQNSVILQQQVRPIFEQPADGGVFAAALIHDRFRVRIWGRPVVIVQEHVVGARFGQQGRVKPLAGLDINKPAPPGRLPLALDSSVPAAKKRSCRALNSCRLSGGAISASRGRGSNTRKAASSSERPFPRMTSRRNSTSMSGRGRFPTCIPRSRKCKNGCVWVRFQSGFCDMYHA